MHTLNEKQQQAVSHKEGPCLVIAGAGTGKTRVITERVAHISAEKWCRNDQILGLTFTDKAAGEMEERLDALMPLGYEPVTLKTFHAFCDELLRRFGMDMGMAPDYTILTGAELWHFVKENLFEFPLEYYRPLNNPTKFIEDLTKHFSRLKEELVSPQKYVDWAEKQKAAADDEPSKLEAKKHLELARAYEKYQALLLDNNYLDFADLHFKVIELFAKRPNILRHLQEHYRYILVDEYQDTNIAQNQIVDLLAAKHKNLMVVGDDDQSIYKFRGAAISNILQFEEKYPDLKKIVLTENYRSSQAILDFAYASIQNNNPDRLEVRAKVNKKLTALRPGDAESVHLVHASTVEQEVEYVIEEIRKSAVPRSEIAILARTNGHLRPFVEGLKQSGIPYQFISERGLFWKDEILDLIAVLRVLANPTDDVSLMRVLRMELWNISMLSIVTALQDAKRERKTLWKKLRDIEGAELLYGTMNDLLEFSKTHTAGETLYRFTETVQLYEKLLSVMSLEAEEKVMNIAAFFNHVLNFERNHTEKSVIDFVSYLDLLDEAGESPNPTHDLSGHDAVHISSVHAAKGLEFDTVFVTHLTNRGFPTDDRSDTIEIPDALIHEILTEGDSHSEEERRLFYVAVTRAKEKLHLTHSDFYNATSAKNPRANKRSRFVDEIIEKVSFTEVKKTIEGVERFLKPAPSKSSRPSEASGETPLGGARERLTQFSYSQLSNFETCPRQYQYGYLFKIPQPANANASFGSTMHNTLLAFYKIVTASKQASLFTEFSPDLSLQNLLKLYEENWLDQGYETKEHMELRRARGREILTKFYDHFKSELSRVRFLEKGFKLRVGDYTISGRVDRADDLDATHLEIIDYKTGKARSQKDVDSDLQLLIYAMAAEQCFGIPASKLTLYFLDDDVKVTTEPSAKSLEKAKDEIIAIADAINVSDFAPTPSKMACQYCPFRKICDAAI